MESLARKKYISPRPQTLDVTAVFDPDKLVGHFDSTMSTDKDGDYDGYFDRRGDKDTDRIRHRDGDPSSCRGLNWD